MRSGRHGGLAAAMLAALGLGFGLGRASAPAPPPRAEAPACPEPPACPDPPAPPDPTPAVVAPPPSPARTVPPPPRAIEDTAPPPAEEDGPTAPRGWSLSWRDDLPFALTPEGFEQTVEEAMETCAPEHLELVDVDCTEPPCYAVLRSKRDELPPKTTDNELLFRFTVNCEPWRANLGTTVDGSTRSSRPFTCPDGSEEWVFLLSSDRYEHALDVVEDWQRSVVRRRLAERTKPWYAQWTCR